eukprot:1120977-Pelagomonas_calceolata.AAC.5
MPREQYSKRVAHGTSARCLAPAHAAWVCALDPLVACISQGNSTSLHRQRHSKGVQLWIRFAQATVQQKRAAVDQVCTGNGTAKACSCGSGLHRQRHSKGVQLWNRLAQAMAQQKRAAVEQVCTQATALQARGRGSGRQRAQRAHACKLHQSRFRPQHCLLICGQQTWKLWCPEGGLEGECCSFTHSHAHSTSEHWASDGCPTREPD